MTKVVLWSYEKQKNVLDFRGGNMINKWDSKMAPSI